MARLTDKQIALIAAARKEQDTNDLRLRNPLALRISPVGDFDADNAADYARPDAFEMTPVVDPLAEAYIMSCGAKKHGERTFSISATKSSVSRLTRLLSALPGHLTFTEAEAPRIEKRNLSRSMFFSTGWNVITLIKSTDGGSLINHEKLSLSNAFVSVRHRFDQEELAAVIYVSAGQNRLFFKFASAGSKRYPWAFTSVEGSEHHQSLMGFNDVHDPILVPADIAVSERHVALKRGWAVLDPAGVMDATADGVDRVVAALPVLGSPGMARLVIGEGPQGGCGANSAVVPAAQVSAAIDGAPAGALVAVDAEVSDAVALHRAGPVACDGLAKPLRPFQAQMVGLHLAGSIGLLNGCAPGTGKTIMTLAAFRERGLAIPGWKGLCVVPKQVISQWGNEARECFPEAHIAVLDSRNLETNLDAARAAAADSNAPLLVIVGYEAMRRNIAALAGCEWDDLACDEAAFLSSPGTARTKAMWRLRERAQVAVALTGTPIDRSLDDMGRVISWARNQADMFVGKRRLSRRFDVTSPESVARMWDALGATVYRRDRSEIADELPAVTTMPMLLDPEPAERALADGARTELKRMYERLEAAITAAAEIDPDDPALADARDDLRTARGAVLGGVTLARAACCDPQAVKASASAGAALLDAAGLIDPAVATGGTKRREIVKLVAQQAQAGEAILIFTDFSSVCATMSEALAEAGVRVGTYSGRDNDRTRADNIARFMAGDLDCLVLTGAGREGLNLQRASVVIHYDLPWIPSQVVQRVGRASRIGASAEKLQVFIPILAGTIEERVAAVLVPRAATAMMALDVHRGVRAATTETGMAVAGLADAVSDREITGNESMFDMARDILAA